MDIKHILFMILATTSITSIASDKTLPLLKSWQGPFENTGIFKYADYDEGVACYVLAPKRVKNSLGTNGVVYEGNNIGSISCVKVTDNKKRK